ncbi:MAG: hypothetical protein QOI12_467 [Alphaproteobacteria bacterium]|jgi:hypothetical protein|nr:hypothetical protein [Alphaproteobacteria bacterium]
MSKLSETQHTILSTAAQHTDGIAALLERLRGRATEKVIEPLLTKGFLEELPATPGMPAWRRDKDGDRSYALIITPAGRAVMNIEPATTPRAAPMRGAIPPPLRTQRSQPPGLLPQNANPSRTPKSHERPSAKHGANQRESQVSKARASRIGNKLQCSRCYGGRQARPSRRS